jgi:hypothetical protein
MLGAFLDEIRSRMPAWCINSRCLETPLVLARYGASAGIVGGALCAARGGAQCRRQGERGTADYKVPCGTKPVSVLLGK